MEMWLFQERSIMADSETQNLERKDFFEWIVEKVDGGFFPNGPFGETE